jgi:ParB/RepB/Spo0J family partition protein
MKTYEPDTSLYVEVSKVHPHPLNTRKVTKKSVIDSGLAESMLAGQISPAVVRPHPEKKGEYQLIAGERRRMACEVNEKPLLVIVRTITDSEVEDMILTDNLQREDPDPMAEAKLIKRRLSEGVAPEEIAAKYGKSELWIKRRMKLLSIIPALREQLKPGGDLAHFNTQMMERLGAMPADHQKELAKNAWSIDECKSLEELNQTLNHEKVNIEGCDFLDDKATAHGKCSSGCSSSKEEDLFGDAKEAGKVCKNRECFEFRRKIAVNLAIQKVLDENKGKALVFFSSKGSPHIEFKDKPFTYLHQWDYEQAYVKSKKATEIITVDLADPTKPKMGWATVKPGKKGKTLTTGASKAVEAKESREDRLRGRRQALLVEKLLVALDAAPVPKSPSLINLVAMFGVNYSATYISSPDRWAMADGKAVKRHNMTNQKEVTAEQAVWDGIRPVLRQRLDFATNKVLLEKKMQDEMKSLAGLIGFDIEKAYKGICETVHPVPASWGEGYDPITLTKKKK